MSLRNYVYRAFVEPPKKVNPASNYAMLAFALLLLGFYVHWRLNLSPDYRGDRHGNAVVSLMLLFNLLAYRFRWPILATVVLRALSSLWLVFAYFYIGFLFYQTVRVQTVRVAEPSKPVADRAVEAVDRFRSGVQQERYQEICQTAESHAFLAVTSLSCPEFLVYFHQKLGDPVNTGRTNVRSMGGRRSDGTIPVELDCKTEYRHGAAHEWFAWRINGKAAVLTRYRVEAEVLSR